ncbi:MAG: acetylxylan esterase [Acidobacteria bacterium]|nr:acetylxylan esterase [Acidobacteriota bacterium]
MNMAKIWMFLLLSALLAAEDFVVFRSPADAPGEQLKQYLNAIGERQLRERDRAIAQIRTKEDLERRKKVVREKILRLIGGLPEVRGPLNTRDVGALDRGDYRIEKIIYESLPGFYVPANVYVPARGKAPFPAVLMPEGHGVDGKAGQREIAVGLARKGFLAMTYDPLGQGERSQYYDPELRESKVGGPTAEHSHANGHTMLIGDNVARYRIWDGIRGIDYLVSRKDVDASRIGCTGCSGGGTLTTYISALDERVKVAAPACYINSWRALLAGPGPQDAEQSFPGFLREGLDIADYVELFAPKPWLIVSTIQDFFPLEGARQTYEEAKRLYALYGEGDRLQWHVGPGGHGTPQPSREAIYAFFLKWLGDGKGDATETPVELDPVENLWCTRTGQVADSLGGETVFTLNKKRAADLIRPQRSDRARLAEEVRALAAITLQPGGAAPPLTIHRSLAREGYRMDVVSYESERGIQIPGLLLVLAKDGAKPAILVADSRPKQVTAVPGGDLEDLVKAGYLVFAVQPRGVPETGQAGRAGFLGDYSQPVRAAVVGKTLAGMRAEDLIRAVDALASRPDVDRSKIAAFGRGACGVPLLYAALLDERMGRVILQETLVSYRAAVDHPMHRNLYEVAVAGALRKYDLEDILAALRPRPVTLINPVDALGKPVRLEELRQQLGTTVDLRSRTRRDALRSFLP